MRKFVVAALLSLMALSACTPSAQREDADVMPVIEGCSVQRFVVQKSNGAQEVLYVARCAPTVTATTSTTIGCGKNCVKKVTTITTVEGVPDGQQPANN